MPTRKAQPFEPKKVNTQALASHVNARSGQKVCVGCKLPNGLVLEIDEEMDMQETTPTGVHSFKLWVKKPGAVRVHGPAVRWGQQVPYPIVGGFALTDNVDADFWYAWLKQNEDQYYVKNNLIFACPTIDAAKGHAKEHKAVRSGMEPLNPARKHIPGTDRTEPVDPRWPRRTQNTVGTITDVEEMDRAGTA